MQDRWINQPTNCVNRVLAFWRSGWLAMCYLLGTSTSTSFVPYLLGGSEDLDSMAFVCFLPTNNETMLVRSLRRRNRFFNTNTASLLR